MLKDNKYLKELNKVLDEHEKRCREFDTKYIEISKKYGFKSKEMRSLYKEYEDIFEYPFPSGYCKVAEEWKHCVEQNYDTLVINSHHIFENEFYDFIDCIEQSGIECFDVLLHAWEDPLIQKLKENGYKCIESCFMIKINKYGYVMEGMRFII